MSKKSIKSFLFKDRKIDWIKHSDLLKVSSFISIDSELGEGAYGKVYSATVKESEHSIPKKFVIKKQELKNEKGIMDPFKKEFLQVNHSNLGYIDLAASQLINEIVLQEICPNFVLNYRFSQRIDVQKTYLELYNELIPDFENLYDWQERRKHSSDEWASVFFQILVALHCMETKYKMTHNDLHGENVLIQKISKGGHICYIINNKKYYLPNLGFLVLINDFGMVRVPSKLEIGWYHKKYTRAIENDIKFVRSYVTKRSPKEFQDYFLEPLKSFDVKSNAKMLDIIEYFYSDNEYTQMKTRNKNGININYTKFVPKKILDTYDTDKKIDKGYLNRGLRGYIN